MNVCIQLPRSRCVVHVAEPLTDAEVAALDEYMIHLAAAAQERHNERRAALTAEERRAEDERAAAAAERAHARAARLRGDSQ